MKSGSALLAHAQHVCIAVSSLNCPPLHSEMHLLSTGSPLAVPGEAQYHPTP